MIFRSQVSIHYRIFHLVSNDNNNTIIKTTFKKINLGPVVQNYRKNSTNWDTLNHYRDCPTNVIVGFYSAILRSKDADRITIYP